MSRQMADPAFRADQTARAFTAPHIAPINAFVDSIRDRDGRGWVPYVPPHHGGIDARVISILRDPGPATQLGTGSGFISVENDDPTAERMADLFDRYGIPVRPSCRGMRTPGTSTRHPVLSSRRPGQAFSSNFSN